MAGYVIHLAVAEEYLRKHNNQEDHGEFIRGVLYPDLAEDKSLSHYGSSSSKVNLVRFLQENKLDNSFNRGVFLHLYTDYLFYNRYLDTFSPEIYNDYDLMNKELMNKYNVKLPEEIKSGVGFKTGNDYKILTLDLATRFIDEISEHSIEEIEKSIRRRPEKWLKYKKEKRDWRRTEVDII